MNTKLALAALLSAFLAFGAYAKGPKGGPTRIDQNTRLQVDFEKVEKGDQLVMACKLCDAMSIVDIETDEQVASYCQEGKEVTCPSCEAKLVVRRTDRIGPRSKGHHARNFHYVNPHGEDCLIVSKVTSDK